MSTPTLNQYTEKSLVLRGNDLDQNILVEFGGKHNEFLKGGPGWIFPNFKKKLVENYISSLTPLTSTPLTSTSTPLTSTPLTSTPLTSKYQDHPVETPIRQIKASCDCIEQIKLLTSKLKILSKKIEILEKNSLRPPNSQATSLDSLDSDCDEPDSYICNNLLRRAKKSSAANE
jgi:hypothetical protein